VYDTYDSVLHVVSTRGKLAADSQRKYDTALQLFHDSVDASALLERMNIARSDVVTPLMFEYTLIERARSQKKRIVLPEGMDDRIIRATHTLLARNVVDITLLGDESAFEAGQQNLASIFPRPRWCLRLMKCLWSALPKNMQYSGPTKA
jgi:phosphate acetyltransferase